MRDKKFYLIGSESSSNMKMLDDLNLVSALSKGGFSIYINPVIMIAGC